MVSNLFAVIPQVVLFFTLLLSGSSYSQYLNELELILVANPPLAEQHHKNKAVYPEKVSEIKLLPLGLIKLYQTLISSQQNNQNVCTFTPSCSHFGTGSIQQFGVVRGILLTSDRLQRCNGLGRKKYPLHPETHKFSDPVEHYRLQKK